SFAAMEQYYQSHGRDWERYALIKARAVGGDRDAGARLQAQLTPFVYRKYLDFTAFDSIREMKQLIEREVKKKGMQDDVKLGPGGIREIEFLVQSHQLIRGGRNRNLRTQSLHRALRVLADEGVVEPSARARLLEDYRFLRNTEHCVQMVADRQTQRLPDAPFARLRLAWSMGFESWEAYRNQLDRHRAHVERAFGDILGAPAAGGAGNAGDANAADAGAVLADVWRSAADAADPAGQPVDETLLSAGFTDPARVARLLKDFRGGRLYQLFSGVERDRIDRLIPLALRQAGARDHPERAMAAFISVLESIGRRSVYLSLLIENPLALAQLLSLCAASAWISRHIGAHPVIMDELLSPLVDVRACGGADIRRELERRLAQADAADPAGDVEAHMNALREFNHAQILRVAAADVLGVLEAGEVCRVLSQLARVVLQQVFDDALQWVGAKHGGGESGVARRGRAGIIAYGKFAAGELGYHSDLDIVVCYDDDAADAGDDSSAPGNRGAETGYYYARVGQRLIHLLTARTHAGPLYELDMRLRPSGHSGTLVTSLAGFAKYQLADAWTWEHQALVRARAVAGGDAFARRFERVRNRVLCRARDPARLRADIALMKEKMARANSVSDANWCDLKLGRGGIVDIEFIVQYWVLRAARDHPAVVRPRTTADTIAALQGAGVIADDAARQLRRIYRLYLRKSLDLKLMDQPLRVAWDEFAGERACIEALWAETFGRG
ncbi:MAG: bifunctional [glutamate--ammonia ligase]-adenylyl-L-tyrosine phosphorylase/[glutamate--ammonia-ligase] adenylyltransferase, partial [Gammaproteobacteria bacterium]|nr:bifunctional [glutamate--ammonia ligase]-adenylyl-L-tyrosine phosphorylase/[glutamate--ammonia-ligase] adenylyltransferase [Gammaproteobacteria bacterium]